MTIEVTSDGRAYGTTVIDKESGRDLSKYVQTVEFQHTAGSLPEITLRMIQPIMRIEGVLRWYLPGVGYIRAVEMEDGARLTLDEIMLRDP